ncbi:unnamed protein product [Fusarium graminearum]|nr:unnamed protein product [Fusarium graminearum]
MAHYELQRALCQLSSASPQSFSTVVVEIRDTSTGQILGTFATQCLISSVSWSHDSQYLAIGDSEHSTVQIWDTSIIISNGLHAKPEDNLIPSSVQFVSEGSLALAKSSTGFGLWHPVDGSIRHMPNPIKQAKLSPDRKFVLVELAGGYSQPSGKFQLLDKSMNVKWTFDDMADVVVITDYSRIASLSRLGEIAVFDYNNASPLCLVTELTVEGTSKFLLSPNGQMAFLSRPSSPVMELWNIEQGERKGISYHEFDEVAKFSPNSEYVSIISSESEFAHSKTIELYHVPTTRIIRKALDIYWNGLQFQPAGNVVALFLRHGIVQLRDLQTWKKTLEFQISGSVGSIESLVLSSTGKLAVMTSEWQSLSTIHVWDTSTGMKLGQCSIDYAGPWYPISFSYNLKYLETPKGRLPLPTVNNNSGGELKSDLPRCFYVGKEWVMQGFDRLLWLPAAYQVTNSRHQTFDLRNGTLAIGHRGNTVKFIKFALDESPIAKKYSSHSN